MSTDSVFQFSVQNNTLTAWKLNSSTSVTFVEAQKFIFKRRLNKSLRTGRHYLHLKMKVLGPALWLTW